jgi:hypothetical protein
MGHPLGLIDDVRISKMALRGRLRHQGDPFGGIEFVG